MPNDRLKKKRIMTFLAETDHKIISRWHISFIFHQIITLFIISYDQYSFYFNTSRICRKLRGRYSPDLLPYALAYGTQVLYLTCTTAHSILKLHFKRKTEYFMHCKWLFLFLLITFKTNIEFTLPINNF